MIRALAVLACLLTVCVTGASAFIRHSQAGLGCAGQAECRQPAATSGNGVAAAPDGTVGIESRPGAAGQTRAVVVARALHRVSASLVGLLAIGLLVFGWNGLSRSGRAAAVLALLLSVFLAWLGRYTPHPVPWVTIGNVGGGFALAAAFAWSAMQTASGSRPSSAATKPSGRSDVTWAGYASVGWILLGLLVWLGLMIGARDAIPACPEPVCLQGARFEAASFDPARAQPSASPAGGQALHLAHRFVALGFVLLIAALVPQLVRAGRGRLAVLATVLLVAQLSLGLATAAGVQPLASASLHNVVAALWGVLLAGLAASGYRSEVRGRAVSSAAPGSTPSSRARNE